MKKKLNNKVLITFFAIALFITVGSIVYANNENAINSEEIVETNNEKSTVEAINEISSDSENDSVSQDLDSEKKTNLETDADLSLIDEDLKNKDIPATAELNLKELSFSGIVQKSPSGNLSAELVRRNNEFHDSVLVRDVEKVEIIDMAGILYSSVYNTEWLDENRYTVHAHLTPSQGVYIVINIEDKSIEKFVGVGFKWNNKKDVLFYVNTCPHFSLERVGDKIVDNKGNIYYESPKDIMITDQFTIANNGSNMVFYANDLSNDERNLYVAEVKDMKINSIELIKDAPLGELIEVKDNKVKIAITEEQIIEIDI